MTTVDALNEAFDAIKAIGITHIRLIVFGKTGNGKSEFGHQLLSFVVPKPSGQVYFVSGAATNAVTKEPVVATIEHRGISISFTDSEGLMDPDGRDPEILRKQLLFNSETNPDGYHVIYFVTPISSRFDASDVIIAEMLQRVYGNDASKHVVGVLSKADMLNSVEDEQKMTQSYTQKLQSWFPGITPIGVVLVNTDAQGLIRRTPSGKNVTQCMMEMWRATLHLIQAQPITCKPPVIPTITVQAPQPRAPSPPPLIPTLPIPIEIAVAPMLAPALLVKKGIGALFCFPASAEVQLWDSLQQRPVTTFIAQVKVGDQIAYTDPVTRKLGWSRVYYVGGDDQMIQHEFVKIAYHLPNTAHTCSIAMTAQHLIYSQSIAEDGNSLKPVMAATLRPGQLICINSVNTAESDINAYGVDKVSQLVPVDSVTVVHSTGLCYVLCESDCLLVDSVLVSCYYLCHWAERSLTYPLRFTSDRFNRSKLCAEIKKVVNAITYPMLERLS